MNVRGDFFKLNALNELNECTGRLFKPKTILESLKPFWNQH